MGCKVGLSGWPRVPGCSTREESESGVPGEPTYCLCTTQMWDPLSSPQSLEVSASFPQAQWGWGDSVAPTTSERPKVCDLQEVAGYFSLFLFPKGSCHFHCSLPHTMAIRVSSALQKGILGLLRAVGSQSYLTAGRFSARSPRIRGLLLARTYTQISLEWESITATISPASFYFVLM